MPEGSSSAAPVIRPGPSLRSVFFIRPARFALACTRAPPRLLEFRFARMPGHRTTACVRHRLFGTEAVWLWGSGGTDTNGHARATCRGRTAIELSILQLGHFQSR